jgi:hypothetical protein
MKKLDAIVLAGIISATVIGAALFIANTMDIPKAYAPPTSCIECAKEFAPGQEAENPGDAVEDAPGLCIGCDSAKDVSPGQLKQKEIEN